MGDKSQIDAKEHSKNVKTGEPGDPDWEARQAVVTGQSEDQRNLREANHGPESDEK